MRWMVRIGAIVWLVVGLGIGVAQAGPLEDAKAQGLVGERIDGYVGVVDSGAPGSIKSLVNQINAEREAKYAEIAKKQGAPTAAVAQIAGTKLIERAPRGEYVMGANGRWQQK
ncbi:MAG: YdbL family protein [Geminicoccaceae bacterium]